MNCLALSDLEQFAEALADGIKAELYLTPKPGLVDLLDNGSHPDLSLLLMGRSVRQLREYLAELAFALYQQKPLAELQSIGLRAEQRMQTELGSNCHRGGIFLTGLLLSAYSECGTSAPQTLSTSVATLSRNYFQQTKTIDSHGQLARTRYQTGGIVTECLNGLPGLFQTALPSLLGNLDNFPYGCYLAMARLMKSCDDTTTLHRGGETGLARLRKAGRKLERSLLRGECCGPLLLQLNDEFRAINLTMGGVADMLGLTFGYLNFGFMQHQLSMLPLEDSESGMILNTFLVKN